MARPTNSKTTKSNEVPVKQLRWRCDPDQLGVATTDDAKPINEIIGQDRALRALRLGLEMKHPGYNVFVTGFSGTGRMTTIKRLLADVGQTSVALRDRCYVNNFRNPDQPILITLKAGEGCALRDDMAALIQDLIKNIPSAFERKRFKEERKRLMELFQERQQSVLKDFERRVREKGFEVTQVQVGQSMRPDISPIVNNQPVTFDQMEGLLQQGQITKEQVEQISKERAGLEAQMENVLRELRNIERKAKDSVRDLAERFILPVVKDMVDEVRQKYDNEKLRAYLDDVQDEIMANLGRFHAPEDHQPPVIPMPGMPPQEEDTFREFSVNVVVDNSETKGVPMVIETNPRFKNLFGTIDREVDRVGVWRSDFTLIKPGSLLQADGGYLVINALDALTEPGVWQTLKRTLRYELLEIQPLETGLFGANSTLKPEPVRIDVKVIMLGDHFVYFLLYEQDDDFKKIFKVRADFDVEMPRSAQSVAKYVSFVKMICNDEKLTPFDHTGLAAVIEQGARLAEQQKKLSTRFNLIADIVREANYWAVKDGVACVSKTQVAMAVAERIERVRLIEGKIHEMIEDGRLLLDIKGTAVGQVNGLTVLDMREYSFGVPARITARTAVGDKGVINIDRESALSGPLHNKGVMILSGYLHSMYAQDKPLAMNASITFEQSYGGVDGDSASSTEIYAILSSLSGVPIRQDIAVTGSVNQKGEIQPIGGVNQKIEGFFDVCSMMGLTGSQGVMIPQQNVSDLMLRDDVVKAVEKRKFHVYAIRTIDEGIEILTGLKAGTRRKSGNFTPGSVHDLANQTLRAYAHHWKEFARR
jgi:lon-related putative ATP-dependent protease